MLVIMLAFCLHLTMLTMLVIFSSQPGQSVATQLQLWKDLAGGKTVAELSTFEKL